MGVAILHAGLRGLRTWQRQPLCLVCRHLAESCCDTHCLDMHYTRSSLSEVAQHMATPAAPAAAWPQQPPHQHAAPTS